MLARRIKLKPNRADESRFNQNAFQLTGLYNWVVLKLFRDASGGIFHTRFDLHTLIVGHGRKCGLNQQTMGMVVDRAFRAHHKRGNRQRPAKLRGQRNRMGAIPLRENVRWRDRTHLYLPGFGVVKCRPDPTFPAGRIKGGLVRKTPRGWYVTLVVDADPKPIPRIDSAEAGVDFGFKDLAVLSTGERIPNPREYQRLKARLGQAHRGLNYRLLGRLHQRLANARRCRNHQISRSLIARHTALYLSRDNYRAMARTGMGKSVHSAGLYQLISMLHTKGRPGGCRVVEVSNRNSTRTCADCGALTGPAGRAGLSVRRWTCSACGAHHDRDINAAVNTARVGAVLAHEIAREH